MILVTGGTGFTGSYILFELLKKNSGPVKALKRPGSPTKETAFIFRHLSEKNNISYDIFDRIQWVEGDVLDIASMEEALNDVDEVYHCAAIVSFSSGDSENVLRTNIEGTKNIVNLCIEKGISRLGYISSVAALKRNGSMPANEDMPSEEPEFSSVYSKSKFFAEMEVWRGIAEGLKAVIVNPTIILGWGDFDKGSLKIFSTIKKGIPVYPPGINGYVDVRDVALILVELMDRQVFGKRFILNAESVTYKILFDKIAAGLKANPPGLKAGKALSYFYSFFSGTIAFLSGRQNMVTREVVHNSFQTYHYDNSLIKKTLDYQFISLDKTIHDACEVYMASGLG